MHVLIFGGVPVVCSQAVPAVQLRCEDLAWQSFLDQTVPETLPKVDIMEVGAHHWMRAVLDAPKRYHRAP